MKTAQFTTLALLLALVCGLLFALYRRMETIESAALRAQYFAQQAADESQSARLSAESAEASAIDTQETVKSNK
jgi:hypothetical protein